MFKCLNCKICNGKACLNELPGMGGVNDNQNFILNCSDWDNIYNKEKDKIPQLSKEKIISILRYAPVTGAVENIGYKDEQSFYYDILSAVDKTGVALSIGDGTPDEKLIYGIEAVTRLNQEKKSKVDCESADCAREDCSRADFTRVDCASFLKPYPDDILLSRIEKCKDISTYIGVDIDSYNIVTMRNKVHLEKKSTCSIKKLMKSINVPFVIKGVFTNEDIELVKETKPDVVYISNHGGRVLTDVGSSANFLKTFGAMLKNYCNEIWVDGGIRKKSDIETACYLGADKVLVARPFITDLCYKGFVDIKKFVE